jgi:hypothetical protein
MSALTNPYSRQATRDGEAPDHVVLVGGRAAYAVPDIPNSTDPEYGFDDAPRLRADHVPSTPDPIRSGRMEPPENDPNDRPYNARRTADFHGRHSDELTAESWNVQQHKLPPGQNPMWEQERAHIRPSAVRSPLGYLFTRPWHIPRNIRDAVGEGAEVHMSMADHRRAYEIYGMRSHDRMGMNTFRLDPKPWDAGLYPPTTQTITPEPGQASGVFTGNQRYGL